MRSRSPLGTNGNQALPMCGGTGVSAQAPCSGELDASCDRCKGPSAGSFGGLIESVQNWETFWVLNELAASAPTHPPLHV